MGVFLFHRTHQNLDYGWGVFLGLRAHLAIGKALLLWPESTVYVNEVLGTVSGALTFLPGVSFCSLQK